MINRKIIYDFGSHNGDDIPYYLLKSDLVVAVEANPGLCLIINSRFKNEILAGRLIVENCVLDVTDSCEGGVAPFFIHKSNDVLSQFPKPNNLNEFRQIYIESKNVIGIIQKYGNPHYIKIDIEHYDQIILKALFENHIFPNYISAESHTIDVFSSMLTLGKYRSFKLVDGSSVSTKYNNYAIGTTNGSINYSFPFHSAGPFGNDVSGPWMTPENFFKLLAFSGLGWKDIHASNVEQADLNYSPQLNVNLSINY